MSTEENRRATILVVEDEDVVRRILAAILQDLGHTVLEARDGEEATGLLDQHVVDLLISDKNLPGISGLDLMRACKEKRPDAEVIMVTGYASYESAVEALRLGACEYIEKPFLDLVAIRNRVQQAIERKFSRELPLRPVALAERLATALKSSGNPREREAVPLAEQLVTALKS
ncbi:MAG: response regulator [Myxococcota bacterium]